MTDPKKIDRIVGLQIGGTVGPNDIVGMHVTMPEQPGIGVKVDINSLNSAVEEVYNKIKSDDPKSDEIKSLAKEILKTASIEAKVRMALALVELSAAVPSIVEAILKIKQLLGV